MLVPPAPPWVMVTLVGEAERAKLGVAEALTVRLTDVVCVKLPETPVMVTVTVPTAAVALAVRVRVLELVDGFGLKAAVTPLGRPDAEKVTLPVNPFCGVIEMLLVPPAPPWVMVTLPGEAERV